MTVDKKLVSQIVARCLNENRANELATELNLVFGTSTTPQEKLAALATTPIYTLTVEQPGYPADGVPGLLALGSDLKAAVLQELAAMIHADSDKDAHKTTWQAIEKSVSAAADTEFDSGIAVNCPDDYLLILDKRFVSEVLRQFHAMPAWS